MSAALEGALLSVLAPGQGLARGYAGLTKPVCSESPAQAFGTERLLQNNSEQSRK